MENQELVSPDGLEKHQSQSSPGEHRYKKFEVKFDLVQMDVEVSKTSKFQVRLRTPNNLMESSKKYKVPVEKLLPFQKSLSAYVEFDDDYFTQVVQFERVEQRYREQKCLLEILCDDKVVSCTQIELTQYIEYDKATKINLKLDSRPIVSISYTIEITQILDYDEESTVMPEIYQKALKA
jgi:hypothetical protein